MEHDCKAAQDAAAHGSSSSKTPAMIERPEKIANLQKSMSLWNDGEMYHQFKVMFFFFLVKHTATQLCIEQY